MAAPKPPAYAKYPELAAYLKKRITGEAKETDQTPLINKIISELEKQIKHRMGFRGIIITEKEDGSGYRININARLITVEGRKLQNPTRTGEQLEAAHKEYLEKIANKSPAPITESKSPKSEDKSKPTGLGL